MKKQEILEKIQKFPISNFKYSDAQVILRLVTILAACHLSGKINRVLKRIQKMEHPEEFINILK
ncbi:hypothetical protein SAMN02910265_01071 [Ruminococcus flavefaciens]|uniref:Uncharacterized protein n=1 Tax=Ruminococcus flavefaciens TaxID=1265 RepID=A0A1H6IM89_RUMFL|nr:hypothetical protein [Ruminococcus flavefaciens]SEH50739.1 hypothetical protein SAMN02910265_01071 [Ruminococcus flavefaciens]